MHIKAKIKEGGYLMKIKATSQPISSGSPLFTGDYRRDASITEAEKAAEVSIAVMNFFQNKQKHKKHITKYR